MTDIYFMMACGFWGLFMGMTVDDDLKAGDYLKMFFASILWPGALVAMVWAGLRKEHRDGRA